MNTSTTTTTTTNPPSPPPPTAAETTPAANTATEETNPTPAANTTAEEINPAANTTTTTNNDDNNTNNNNNNTNNINNDDNNNATSDDVSTPSNPLSPPPPDDDTTTTTSEVPIIPKRRRKRKHYQGTISMVLRPHSSSRSSSSLLDSLSLSLPRRRRRIADLSKDPPPLDVDALIAISVGFPVDSLTEEEIDDAVIPTLGSADQSQYISVRNLILSKWRSNVSSLITRDHVMESAKPEHRHLVDAALGFLVNRGYVNFGLAPEIKEKKPCDNNGDGVVGEANIVVVGAGLAGLCAARQLRDMGFKVVVLEGRARPGGRVRTRKMCGEEGSVVGAADLGGSVLTGINGNPLGVLARQLGFPLHKVRDICPLYLPNGKAVDSDVDSRVEAAFNKLLDRVCKLRQVMMEEMRSVDVSLGTALEAFRKVVNVADDPQEKMLLNWHLANLEYANASLMSNLSMAFWDQDDPYEMGGDHCFIPGGNERFIRALAEDLPIFYNRTVESIRYGDDGVLVYAGGQEFRADMVLCTMPLGVLKRGDIEFVPPLPQKKRDAIDRLGFGLLNKVAMLFPYNFWGAEIDTFGHLSEDPSRRGEFFLFYSYSSVSGGPLLVALVAGEAAIEFEKVSPMESVGRVMDILRGIFYPKGVDVPDPVQAVCTRWGQDRFTYGSYSYVAIGASGDDYDILAESIGNGRVFFAGEATNRQYPATMHGAFLSGMREAANILKAAKRRSLIPADKAENSSSENIEDLSKIFLKPDMQFGSFSVLFDPRSDDPESQSLLRVEFRGEKIETSALYLYGLLSRCQALELNKVETDLDRLNLLNGKFDLRLVGKKGLCSAAESLIAAVKANICSKEGA
ncbi:lysine-specific histone demethylase 1 homolog 1-like [Chenopodium quinoa]|uniref:lysine-specific histone demethylase 1 homolog 1-like n=1 Tax=Chenopodium quinoa TaxID=63459 RepID=UPI000B77B451|nr:lysine-specific histone demethylase 1 homolog 1-like [Chenopodium quinoa]